MAIGPPFSGTGAASPLSITSPDGLLTRLTVDANHNLTAISYPDHSAYGFSYTPEGLLTEKTDPGAAVSFSNTMPTG